MAPEAIDAFPSVTIEEAIARVSSGQRIVDVREQEEWDAVHSPDAQLLPMSELQGRLDELPQGEEFLVICHAGGRSARVTATLVDAGYDAVNVEGGMSAWEAVGGAVAAGASGDQRG
jgi:rhodanese-related sulfurtransferase